MDFAKVAAIVEEEQGSSEGGVAGAQPSLADAESKTAKASKSQDKAANSDVVVEIHPWHQLSDHVR